MIEIFISDRRVGRMALTPEGLCGFEYDVIALVTEIGLSKQSANQIIQELTDKCTTRKMAKFKLR